MKKIALILLAFCAFIVSCQKYVKIPVSYTVESAQGTALPDIFVPDAGTYDLAAWVKFLTGTNEDSVTIVLKGLPADVVVERDTLKGLPSYTGHFMLHTTNAVHATYSLSILAYASGSQPKTYNFKMTVIAADCAQGLFGSYTGNNACTGRTYNYPVTIGSAGVANTFNISNFGGYGTNTVTHVVINCNNDSLTIPAQNIGNGAVLEGKGVFTASTITLYYTASSTPGGFPETCTAIFNR